MAMNGRAESLWFLFDLGEWDSLLDLGRRILRWNEQPTQHALKVMGSLAEVLAWRHHLAEAHDICARLLSKAREAEDYEVLVPALAVSALVAEKRAEPKVAVELATDLRSVTRHSPPWRSRHLPTILRVLVSAGEVEKALSFAAGLDVAASRDRYSVLTGRAILAEAQGRAEEARELYEQAAGRWADYGFVLEEGQAHFGLARCLIDMGDGQSAAQPLHEARAIFSRLGAVPLIQEVDRHLGKTTALSS
jgi:tetratricopeptide (TPR) repeat protein